jgi:hypothetical protein
MFISLYRLYIFISLNHLTQLRKEAASADDAFSISSLQASAPKSLPDLSRTVVPPSRSAAVTENDKRSTAAGIPEEHIGFENSSAFGGAFDQHTPPHSVAPSGQAIAKASAGAPIPAAVFLTQGQTNNATANTATSDSDNWGSTDPWATNQSSDAWGGPAAAVTSWEAPAAGPTSGDGFFGDAFGGSSGSSAFGSAPAPAPAPSSAAAAPAFEAAGSGGDAWGSIVAPSSVSSFSSDSSDLFNSFVNAPITGFSFSSNSQLPSSSTASIDDFFS